MWGGRKREPSPRVHRFEGNKAEMTNRLHVVILNRDNESLPFYLCMQEWLFDIQNASMIVNFFPICHHATQFRVDSLNLDHSYIHTDCRASAGWYSWKSWVVSCISSRWNTSYPLLLLIFHFCILFCNSITRWAQLTNIHNLLHCASWSWYQQKILNTHFDNSKIFRLWGIHNSNPRENVECYISEFGPYAAITEKWVWHVIPSNEKESPLVPISGFVMLL